VPRLCHGCQCPSPARTSSNTNSPTFPPALGDDVGAPHFQTNQFENGGLPSRKSTVPTNHLFVTGRTLLNGFQHFTKTLHAECSGGGRRWAWMWFGLRQAIKKTVSTCDNLIWLTRACKVHPARDRTQLLPRVCHRATMCAGPLVT
jgi:hypothetical protein